MINWLNGIYALNVQQKERSIEHNPILLPLKREKYAEIFRNIIDAYFL